MAIVPLTGKRFAKIYDRRTNVESADFMSELALLYPESIKIKLIQDNLNTHTKASFYKNFTAPEAQNLSEKFEFNFTPKKGSWLNAAEIEFSALARVSLKKRIPTKEKLAEQVEFCIKDREKKKLKYLGNLI